MPAAASILSKLAAIALLLMCVAAGVAMGVVPLFDRLVEIRESVTTRRQVLGHLRASLIEAKPASERKEPADGTPTLFLAGESHAVMAAQLQAVLRTAAEAQGWRLISTQALPVRQQSTLQMIGVEARLTSSMAGLQWILSQLEAARPVVLVSALQITPLVASLSEPTLEEQLTVRIEILGAATAGQPEAIDASPRQQ